MLLDGDGQSGDPVLRFEWRRQAKRYVEAVDKPISVAHPNLEAS
jgi:hypothetical protein